jgi:Fe-Mn family superoxide dismutase
MLQKTKPGTVSAVQEVDGTSIRKYVAKPFETEAFGKISAAALDAHLGLYQGYVVQTNSILESMAQLDKVGGELMENPVRPAEGLARRLAFELNGVTLHELFFEQYLKPTTPGTGNFERAAEQNFGRVEQWRSSVCALAKTRGPGWAITAFDEGRGYLHNFWIDMHHLYVPAGLRVVFVLDLWEHAYLADYGVKGRAEYVDAAMHAACMSCLDARIGTDAR